MLSDEKILLDACRDKAWAGQGCILVLNGESGVGKTHAVKMFLKTIRMQGDAHIFSAKGRPQTTNPLYLVYEALANHLKEYQWSVDSLRLLFKEYTVMLPRMASLIRPLIQDDAYLRGIEATVVPHLIETSPYPHCLDFLKELSGSRPLVFWIDDVQWADRETIGFIMYLRDQLSEEAMLWILCLNKRRRGIPDKEYLDDALTYLGYGTADGHVLFHECRPCAPDEIGALTESIIGTKVIADDRVLQALYEKSRGIPFILKILLEVLRFNHGSSFTPEICRLDTSIEAFSLPSSLKTAIEERVRAVYRAMPQARGVLELAAALGERFEVTTIDSILELCNAYKLLVDIEENQFLVRHLLSEELWEFDHATIRDFIYETLGEKAAMLHRKIARFLQATESENYSRIAYHFQQAGDSEFFITYTAQQAENWLKQGFFLEARDALEVLWKTPGFFEHSEYVQRGATLMHARARAHFHLSDYETCLQMIHRIQADSANSANDPQILLLKAKCLNKLNSSNCFREALNILDTLTARVDLESDPILLGRARAEMVVSFAHLNRFSEAREAFSQSELLLNPYEAPVERAQLMRRSCMFYEPEVAEKILLRAAEVFERHKVDHEFVMSLNNLASVYLDSSDPRNAATILAKAIKRSSRIGNFGMDYLLNNMALVRFLDRDYEQSLAVLREALAFAKRQVNRIVILNNQAAALLGLGETAAAEELVRRLLPEAERVGEDVYLIGISFNMALFLIKTSRPLEALLELARCQIDSVKEFGSYYERQRSLLLGTILREQGAVRIDIDFPNRFLGDPEPHTIDLQFWGDA
ncbi:MAG TPA: AAA family ATPase [Thermoanaerobaculia bacterium]|jgi:tetratricopeptide (TPR) repeat protein|nr:AAA family ATPase [Thermoanaerobaculia bacterium]